MPRLLVKNTGDFSLVLTDGTHGIRIRPDEFFWYEADSLPEFLIQQFDAGNIDYWIYGSNPGIDWRKEGF